MHKYGRGLGARVLPIYGGQAITRQLGMLKRGVDVVVATPGRALDHIARGTLDLADLKVVVLDEADEMLDMGFAEDLEAIFDATPADAPDGALLRDDAAADRAHRAPPPPRARADHRRPRDDATDDGAPLVRQSAYIVARAHKPAALGRVLDVEAPAGGARLLPHPRRGRPARRDAQRPRLPRRGAARRHDPGPARPRDGAPAQRDRGPDRRHRRRRPRPRHRPAHARRQLRRPVRPRLLHAPHRPRRPRGPRGRRDHARRAARAPDAQDDRALDRPDHDREAPDASPTCAPAGSS